MNRGGTIMIYLLSPLPRRHHRADKGSDMNARIISLQCGNKNVPNVCRVSLDIKLVFANLQWFGCLKAVALRRQVYNNIVQQAQDSINHGHL